MAVTKIQAIVDGAIVLALIAAYTILSVSGQDGTPLLYIIGGAAGRSAVQSTVAQVTKP